MADRIVPVLLSLLLIATLAPGCKEVISPPPPVTTAAPTPPKVSLSLALSALPAAGQEGGIDIKGLTLTKVWGYGVDSSGLARTWVLGMQGRGKTALLTYSEGQFKELDLPTALPQGEVRIGDLLSPEDLFRKNLNTLVRGMNSKRVGECDLALDGNSYQVTIHSPSESSTLSFNAKTGELMASP